MFLTVRQFLNFPQLPFRDRLDENFLNAAAFPAAVFLLASDIARN
ncbi:hypothetical protein THTE_4479 [Thermogutta terrifontis]|uniref:Uncharacterized protein n=1 Tax=Thermogutta terrifontis TaxID=1331910 RepID=A0A286RM98_9BACT|nr:hypothetical protein THTE_4479 [Thermogutta terrifontis]